MLIAAIIVLIQLIFVGRALSRRNREPVSRLAWVAAIVFLPLVGAFAYVLLGEINIGSRLVARQIRVRAALERRLIETHPTAFLISSEPSSDWPTPFQTGWSVNHFAPALCSHAELFDDSNVSIDRIVADIDAAAETVHIVFYIWLPDRNGRKVAEALQRAAARGVMCRMLVDDLGSRALIRSELWDDLAASGVIAMRALTVGNLLIRAFSGRIDLRNHRKIVVIDSKVAYCGSQNCADPEFWPKAKFGPWVDAMLRLEGNIVRQIHQVFAVDWLTFNDDDLNDALGRTDMGRTGFPAQMIASGPTVRYGAMEDTFLSLFHFARKRLVITTPYYVPNAAIQNAICAAARRGVKTTLILPRRVDDRFVAAASKSHYLELLSAGVRIYEYPLGLLHTKSITVDGTLALIGSANIDRRSLELNYENCLLIEDGTLVAEIISLQERYIRDSQIIDLIEVGAWSWWKRLYYNAAAMMSPIL